MSDDDVKTAFVLLSAAVARFLYTTDDDLPDRWDTLTETYDATFHVFCCPELARRDLAGIEREYFAPIAATS